MAEMVVVKCDIGSKAATVLCPSCARISRQILKVAYNNIGNNELLTAHTCPVCGGVYHICNSYEAENWKVAYSKYVLNPDAYNSIVKENHNRRQQTVMDMQPQEQPNSIWPIGFTPPEEQSKPISMPDVARIKFEKEENTPAIETRIASDTKENEKTVKTESEHNINDVASSSASEMDVEPSLLERKIERWKKELLDTGKRNRMINYRESKRQTLKILEPSATELFNILVSEKTLTFQRPISKDSDFRTYSVLALLETLSYSLPVHVGDIKAEGTVMEREKTLKNLRAKAKLAQEEQGTNILYLCFGFILWREQNKDSSPWLKSPLLMMPVQLGIKSLNAPYTLTKSDDEIEVNPTLDYLFNQDYSIDLPTFEFKNKDSFDEYMEKIEELIDKKGWKLLREVNLGLLSFLKISMYHDLNDNRAQMMRNPVIQAISGNRSALGDLPSEALDFDFDKTPPTKWHEVIDSDSSQEEAIWLSKLGVSFVMQGPPGTGKSQTITNIIAEALGDGKKVLFVSEKSAALQVVLKRLTDARLDDFCLSLHNYKANPKYDGFFAEDKEDEFFVKNLENVQGDERDTIFFSIGYAKTKEQKASGKPMAMRFGPLGVSGGERRLNVAITRAKLNVKLISSILPSDIDLSRTESDGIRMLRSYIEFAVNGGATLASANQSRVPDEFANAIYRFICDKGYKARQYVGCSGYRIDIAVEHPEIEGEFVAGIECDGVSYASGKTARDRDRLRGSVLKRMGWELYRVWSTEWYKNPETEGAKLVEFIEKATKKGNERLKTVLEEKQAVERKKQAEAEREKAEAEKKERQRQEEERRLEETEKARAEQAIERRRKALGERKAAEARRLEEQRLKAEAERKRIEEEGKEKSSDSSYDWVKTGVWVHHGTFGLGKVKELSTNYVTVSFQGSEKRFPMPAAFEKGFLKRLSVPTTGNNTVSASKMNKSGGQNKGGLYGELENSGFQCIDNRTSSSIIWVIYDANKRDILEAIAAKYHVAYKLEKRGAMATGGKTAWRIMV